MTAENRSYIVKVNDFEFSFTTEEINDLNLITHHSGQMNCIRNGRSVNATLSSPSITGKKISLELEGEAFEVTIQDELDLMLEKMGFDNVSTKKLKEIKAPMPGLVLEIAVTVGQQLMKGDKLLILEAMKMENSIILHDDATIKKINITAGQAVDKGQVLLELD